MAFVPFALFQSVTEKCSAEMGFLHIRIFRSQWPVERMRVLQ